MSTVPNKIAVVSNTATPGNADILSAAWKRRLPARNVTQEKQHSRSSRLRTALLQCVMFFFFAGCQSVTPGLPEQALLVPHDRGCAKIIVGDDLKDLMSMFEKSEKTKFTSFDEYEKHRQSLASSKDTQATSREGGADISAETQPCVLVNSEDEHSVYLLHNGVFFLFCTIDTTGDAFVFHDYPRMKYEIDQRTQNIRVSPNTYIYLNKATKEERASVFDMLAHAYDGDSQDEWDTDESEAYDYMRRFYEKQ